MLQFAADLTIFKIKKNMRRLAFIFSFLVLMSCQPTENKENQADLVNTNKNTLKADTTKNEGIIYILNYSNKDTLSVWSSDRGWILKSKEVAILPQELSFVDFNKDGFEDIFFSYANTSGWCNLLLYDAATKNYKYIERFINFLNPIHISNTNYYYSYAEIGCENAHWQSFLFQIQGVEAIERGFIEGNECDGKDKKGIFVYNESDFQTRKLIEKIPTANASSNPEWIANYWKKSWQKFK